MNQFEDQLQKLHPDTLACLQAVCLGHGALPVIEAAARAGPMQPHLQRLADLGLVVLQDGQWTPTWSGRGVYNWRQQVLWAESTGEAQVPGPRTEENGDQLVTDCPEYRPIYSCPGRCWCGHFRSEHASEAPETAAKFLAHKREQNRRQALLNRGSGRSILELYGKLYEDQLAALRIVHRARAEASPPRNSERHCAHASRPKAVCSAM